jgi:lipopolysaccharide export system permease protein
LSDLGLSSGIYELAFWKKALQPFSTVVLVFVAVSFVFGPMRSVAIGSRVFAGLLVGLSFKYVQDLLGPSSLVFGFEPVFASLTPSLICVVIGLYLLRRAG